MATLAHKLGRIEPELAPHVAYLLADGVAYASGELGRAPALSTDGGPGQLGQPWRRWNRSWPASSCTAKTSRVLLQRNKQQPDKSSRGRTPQAAGRTTRPANPDNSSRGRTTRWWPRPRTCPAVVNEVVPVRPRSCPGSFAYWPEWTVARGNAPGARAKTVESRTEPMFDPAATRG